MASGETFEMLYVSLFKGERTYTFEFTTDDDPDKVESMLSNMERNGWTIMHAYMHTDYTDTRTVGRGELLGTSCGANIAAIFSALVENPGNAGVIYSYGELFSWEAEGFERCVYGRRYKDPYFGVFDWDTYRADFAKQFFSESKDEEIPTNVVVDWTATGDVILEDFVTNEFGSEIYIFANS